MQILVTRQLKTGVEDLRKIHEMKYWSKPKNRPSIAARDINLFKVLFFIAIPN